jgi:hypothetical protein
MGLKTRVGYSKRPFLKNYQKFMARKPATDKLALVSNTAEIALYSGLTVGVLGSPLTNEREKFVGAMLFGFMAYQSWVTTNALVSTGFIGRK